MKARDIQVGRTYLVNLGGGNATVTVTMKCIGDGWLVQITGSVGKMRVWDARKFIREIITSDGIPMTIQAGGAAGSPPGPPAPASSSRGSGGAGEPGDTRAAVNPLVDRAVISFETK